MPKEYPFILNIDSDAITSSGSANDTINVGSNEEIVISYLKIVSATGAFDLEITDQAGIAYQQEAVRWAISATDQYPLNFPFALQMPPSSTFTFKFTDRSSGANRVQMQLWGKRVLV